MGGYSEQIVFALSRDHRMRTGVLMQPTEDAARSIGMVCIHGLGASFSWPTYVQLGRALAEQGYRFVSGDTRGHDGFSVDRPWPVNFHLEDWHLGGNCFLRWDEEPHDVAGWIDFLVAQGAERVILFGHSAGVHRVTYYQAVQQDPRVVGLVLAGGADRATAVDPTRLERAKQLVAEGKANTLLPLPEGGPISGREMESAARLVSWERVVSQFAAEGHTPWIARIGVPVLATYGTVETRANPDLPADLESMRTRAVQVPSFDIQVIEGADHLYTGHEKALAEVVASWLETLPGMSAVPQGHW
jgi:pimeloyl-ACP methyl ester carboxylesterase